MHALRANHPVCGARVAALIAQAGLLRSAPAALASDDSVGIHTREWHNGDWVEHPVLAQGIRKPSESGFIKNLPGLIRVLDDFIDSDAA